MSKSIKSILFGLFFLLRFTPLFAQSGLEGLILDAKTKEPLIGATLMVDGTTLTGIASMDGRYSLPGLAPGSYDLTVRYVSYETQHLKAVVVRSGSVTQLDVSLQPADVQLAGVQVMGVRRTNTDLAMLSQTKLTPLVVSGVSSQQIARSLDRDAGEVVKRVPGVTVLDNRFVVVRGLNQRYNNVWLNDVSTPSSEADSRAFSFDVLPGGLIDNLLVFKSPAPELPADFSGGFVKVYTKSIPESNNFQISIQWSAQEGSSLADFSTTSSTWSDALGMGAAARSLPSDFPQKVSSSSSRAVLADYASDLQRDWSVRRVTALPDVRLSATLNRSFRWGGVKVGNITSLHYSNAYRSDDIVNKRYGIYQKDIDQPYARNDYQDEQFNQDTKLGLMHNWSFQFDDHHRLDFRNFFNQTGKNRFTDRQGEDNNNDYTIHETESLYWNRSTYSGQIGGKHRFESAKTKLDWVLGYAYANRNEPDRIIVTTRLNKDETSPYFGRYGTDGNDIRRNFQRLDEHVVSFNSNLEKNLEWAGQPVILQTGLTSEYKHRGFAARNFVYTFRTDLLPDGFVYQDIESMFSDENMQTGGILLKENTNKSDSYTASSWLSAGYAALSATLTGLLDVHAGVRVERNVLDLDGYESDGTAPVSIRRIGLDLFPSVNLTGHLNEKNQLRLAFGTSINRPEFREVAPYVYYDFERFSNFEGNAGLRDAHVMNLDLRYELYPTPSETFTVAFFWKHFADPIEMTYFEVGGQQQYTYRNALRARNLGVEVDVRKNLTALGLPHCTVVMNGSLIGSRVFFEDGDFERDRAMQGQSPWLLNAGLFYDLPESGWKGSLMYNSSGKRILVVGVVNQDISEDLPDIYEMPRHLVDLSVGKRIGDRLELTLGIRDLLSQPVRYRQFPKFTDADGVLQQREQTTRSFTPGRQIGLSLLLKL